MGEMRSDITLHCGATWGFFMGLMSFFFFLAAVFYSYGKIYGKIYYKEFFPGDSL